MHPNATAFPIDAGIGDSHYEAQQWLDAQSEGVRSRL